jgi:hypothetical protein
MRPNKSVPGLRFYDSQWLHSGIVEVADRRADAVFVLLHQFDKNRKIVGLTPVFLVL